MARPGAPLEGSGGLGARAASSRLRRQPLYGRAPGAAAGSWAGSGGPAVADAATAAQLSQPPSSGARAGPARSPPGRGGAGGGAGRGAARTLPSPPGRARGGARPGRPSRLRAGRLSGPPGFSSSEFAPNRFASGPSAAESGLEDAFCYLDSFGWFPKLYWRQLKSKLSLKEGLLQSFAYTINQISGLCLHITKQQNFENWKVRSVGSDAADTGRLNPKSAMRKFEKPTRIPQRLRNWWQQVALELRWSTLKPEVVQSQFRKQFNIQTPPVSGCTGNWEIKWADTETHRSFPGGSHNPGSQS
nr:uncharacterized protein LOC105868512 [Microcebus murinus]